MKLFISTKQNVDIFANIFRHLPKLSPHISLYFDTDKIYAQGMDQSHVCLFEVQLVKEWFDEYEFEKGDMKVISLSTELLFKIINTREEHQSICMTYKGETDTLNINFESDTKTEYNKYFELRLIELDSELMNVDDYNSQADMLFPTKNFASLIEQLSIFNEVMKITCNEEEIILKTSGDNGSMAVPVNIDDLMEYGIEEGQTIEQSFSLPHLSTICLFQKLSSNVSIGLGDDVPLLMIYDLGGEMNHVDKHDVDDEDEEVESINYIKFYLAPKIEID
jgi:proliferating cell nuclear antigen PCNA